MSTTLTASLRRPGGHSWKTRLIHLLDHLKRQDDIADFAGLTVPDQFNLALILEQEKTILVRQGFVGLDIADYLLLFLFSRITYSFSLSSCVDSYTT